MSHTWTRAHTRAIDGAKRRIHRTVAGLGTGRLCGLCGWEGRTFTRHGVEPKVRADARCPNCGSLERNRLAYRLLSDRIATGQSTLHSAPEGCVQRWLAGVSETYVSIDLDARRAQRIEDLTAMTFPAASFSLVYCSNVLEHIPDDAAALGEIRRVLKPGGYAALMVPIRGETTDEDLTITDPAERLARYTQFDHVRFYGLDFAGRIEAAGFSVEVLDDTSLPPETVEAERLTYPTTRQVFLATAV